MTEMTRKTIYKWFWVWGFEKEELWLNSMAENGWVLDGVGLCKYEFVRSEPGQYSVRLAMHGHDSDYMDFMAETGAEYVGRLFQWVYFRKKTDEGRFELFSDIDSKIGHLGMISRLLAIVCIANLVIGLVNTINTALHIGWINLLCAALLSYALGRIHGKKEALEKERSIHE